MGKNGYTQSLYHIFQKNATGEYIFFGEREKFLFPKILQIRAMEKREG
jgi:hypothetical protein